MHRAHTYDDPWAEAWHQMPPWVHRLFATGSEPGQGHRAGPGRGRPSPRHAPAPDFGPFGPMFAKAFMGGGGRGHRHRRGPRASRGDIRAAILRLLAEEPMHGYQLMQEMTERSGGVWRPSPGSVYPTLSQLEDEGLVEGEKDGGRRVFSLTDDGRAEAESLDTDPWEAVGEAVDEEVVSLRDEIASTAGAVMAVATSGDAELVESAREILREARRSLYGLLADHEA